MSILPWRRRKTDDLLPVLPSQYLPPAPQPYGATFGFPVVRVYTAESVLTDDEARETAQRLRAEYERLQPSGPSRQDLLDAVAALTTEIAAERDAHAATRARLLPRYGDSPPVDVQPAEPHVYWSLCDQTDSDPLDADAVDVGPSMELRHAIIEWEGEVLDQADEFSRWVIALPDRLVPPQPRDAAGRFVRQLQS